MDKRVIITGATGFIGRHLVQSLLEDGYPVTALTRNAAKACQILGAEVECLQWDGASPSGWGHRAENALAIINLAGASIADYWTASQKKAILESRINASRAVREAVEKASQKPQMVLQGSAVGFYGPDNGDQVLAEDSPKGPGFLAGVVDQWEKEMAPVSGLGTRLILLRTGLVLGEGEGLLAKMSLPFKLFMGGSLGSGEQWLPWIHIADQVGAIRFLMSNKSAAGIYNLCGPHPVQMKAFVQAFGSATHRPAWLPVPGFALKLLLQDMAEETVLASQRALPNQLLASGYTFRFPELGPALEDILG